jgi:hypothetical protein
MNNIVSVGLLLGLVHVCLGCGIVILNIVRLPLLHGVNTSVGGRDEECLVLAVSSVAVFL